MFPSFVSTAVKEDNLLERIAFQTRKNHLGKAAISVPLCSSSISGFIIRFPWASEMKINVFLIMWHRLGF